jgi:hypothetical protein
VLLLAHHLDGPGRGILPGRLDGGLPVELCDVVPHVLLHARLDRLWGFRGGVGGFRGERGGRRGVMAGRRRRSSRTTSTTVMMMMMMRRRRMMMMMMMMRRRRRSRSWGW